MRDFDFFLPANIPSPAGFAGGEHVPSNEKSRGCTPHETKKIHKRHKSPSEREEVVVVCGGGWCVTERHVIRFSRRQKFLSMTVSLFSLKFTTLRLKCTNNTLKPSSLRRPLKSENKDRLAFVGLHSLLQTS